MTMHRTDELIKSIRELMRLDPQDVSDGKIRLCLLECARHIGILERQMNELRARLGD